ncbi:DUF502 domain-containing protein [bacterium]|nr:DUF502 domain-containing protein [bacterium]
MNRTRLPKIRTLFRAHFVSGLLILIPIAVIVWMLSRFALFLWSLQELLPEVVRQGLLSEEHAWAVIVKVALTLTLALGLAFLISLLGWVSQQYLGRKLLELVSDIIQRIPVVRSVYSALDQMLRAFGSEGGQQFNRVVYLEYPRPGIWTLGFVTGNAKVSSLPEGCLNVFVPTTPNPTGGFYLIVPENQVRDARMGVEDAFRTILSLGVAQPSPKERTNG